MSAINSRPDSHVAAADAAADFATKTDESQVNVGLSALSSKAASDTLWLGKLQTCRREQRALATVSRNKDASICTTEDIAKHYSFLAEDSSIEKLYSPYNGKNK